MTLEETLRDEASRLEAFPVARHKVFMAHAAVTALPRAAADAIDAYTRRATEDSQENPWTYERIRGARAAAARVLGCDADEVALLGPTSLGLNMVAAGLPWQPGDEVVYYPDDYPANVYPWTGLEGRGVKAVPVRPVELGHIRWSDVETVITRRTRLVALASCNFLSGYRIDVDGIGRRLRERDVLFSLDGIQTVGAFPVSVDHVDFLSADSHKWLLGPSGAGIFYVKRSRMELLRPALLGAMNVVSPEFIAQADLRFHSGARRYEPGTLPVPGIVGMAASMELLLEAGIDAVGRRILDLRRGLLDRVRPLGYRLATEEADRSPDTTDAERSGIVSVHHPDRDMREAFRRLGEAGVVLSLRQDRQGRKRLRFSPHFYNTEGELDRVAEVLAEAGR